MIPTGLRTFGNLDSLQKSYSIFKLKNPEIWNASPDTAWHLYSEPLFPRHFVDLALGNIEVDLSKKILTFKHFQDLQWLHTLAPLHLLNIKLAVQLAAHCCTAMCTCASTSATKSRILVIGPSWARDKKSGRSKSRDNAQEMFFTPMQHYTELHFQKKCE